MKKLAVEFHDATVKAIHRRGGDLVLELSVYVHRSEKRPGSDDGDGWYQDAEARLLGSTPQREPARLPLNVSEGSVTVGGAALADLLPLPCNMTGSVEIELSGAEGALRATGSGLLVTLKGEPGPVEEFRRSSE
jgi:hypothetical protein